jgi:hypothetical protein
LACQTSRVAPASGAPDDDSTRPRTTHFSPVPTRSMSSPRPLTGDSTTWNGPSTVDSVSAPDFRLVIVSTSIDSPSTSDSRMNSCRVSSHFWPVLVRKSIAVSHSGMVSSVSRANACRCVTRLPRISRSRWSGVCAKESMTAAAAVSSVKSVAMPASVSPWAA